MTTILDRIRHVVETLKSRGKMMMTGHQQQEGDVDEALIPLQKVSVIEEHHMCLSVSVT